MTSEVTVSFKAYLRRNDSQENPEVRRFGVDRDVVSSFTYMKEKLQAVFPSLKGKVFTVSWKDCDGDDVLISTDEELIIALTEGKSDVHKLYVDVKGDLEDMPDAMNVEESGVGDNVHVGVICDGCSGSVEGFRYKCAVCHDFDLCSSCEGKGLHSEHIMLRLPIELSWHPRKHNIIHHLSKSVRKGEGKKNEEGHRRSWRGKHGHHDRRCSPDQNGPRECPASASSERQHGGCPMRDHGIRPSFMDFLSSYLGENVSKDSMESKEYLRTIGRTVAQFLDPLGIAVNVEVREDTPTPSSSKTAEAETQSQKASCEKQKNVNFSHDTTTNSTSNEAAASPAPDVVCENVEMMDETSQSSTRVQRAESGDPELEQWTVVNNAAPTEVLQDTQMPSAPSAAAAASSDVAAKTTTDGQVEVDTANRAAAMAAAAAAQADRQASAAMQYAESMRDYMAMPSTHYRAIFRPAVPPNQQYFPNTQTPFDQSSQLHPDPKIAEAVATMMSMGFSNDGGWLTQLLASKNGDISQALDVLQPVRNT